MASPAVAFVTTRVKHRLPLRATRDLPFAHPTLLSKLGVVGCPCFHRQTSRRLRAAAARRPAPIRSAKAFPAACADCACHCVHAGGRDRAALSRRHISMIIAGRWQFEMLGERCGHLGGVGSVARVMSRLAPPSGRRGRGSAPEPGRRCANRPLQCGAHRARGPAKTGIWRRARLTGVAREHPSVRPSSFRWAADG